MKVVRISFKKLSLILFVDLLLTEFIAENAIYKLQIASYKLQYVINPTMANRLSI
jgi:hypothetical protein